MTGAEEVVQEVEIVVEEGVEVENDVTKRKSANQVVQKGTIPFVLVHFTVIH